MATSSTPWMNHNGEELIDQGILREKKSNSEQGTEEFFKIIILKDRSRDVSHQ